MHVALLEKQKTNIKPYIFASKRGFRKLSVHCGGRACWRILKAIQLCQKKKKHFLLYYKSKYILCMFKHSIAA